MLLLRMMFTYMTTLDCNHSPLTFHCQISQASDPFSVLTDILKWCYQQSLNNHLSLLHVCMIAVNHYASYHITIRISLRPVLCIVINLPASLLCFLERKCMFPDLYSFPTDQRWMGKWYVGNNAWHVEDWTSHILSRIPQVLSSQHLSWHRWLCQWTWKRSLAPCYY